MNLSDHDILELNELCNALVDQSISDEQKAELAHWLSTSDDARQFYVRVMGLSASMCSYAAEMQTEEPDRAAAPTHSTKRWRWAISIAGVAAMSSIAALIILAVWLGRTQPKANDVVKAVDPTPAVTDDEFVAKLTGSKECEWVSPAAGVLPNGRLRKGQRIELANGFAEITFDCGAKVLLQGPASLDANTAWSATLNRGTLKASLPPEAMGFSISNPTVEVVDIGTEFTMLSDASGAAAEVLVLKGEVAATPRVPADHPSIILKERESKRFESGGVINVNTTDQRLHELSQDVPIDHFAPPAGYAHWSFDELTDNIFRGTGVGLSGEAPDAQVFFGSATSAIRPDGHLGNGLRFDGRLYATAGFPGISENSPHTVAFWVNIPADASPTNAYAMLGWGATRKALGTHPIHIVWNRSPGDGPMGALRTDYGGGFAMGGTSLRDGRWHHVAVVFIPRDDPEAPMEVKQYVDGRFDGQGKPSPPGSDIFNKMSSDDAVRITNGTIWLGCRVGVKSKAVARTDRFVGSIDELFIADRALEPQDIVRLWTSNQL